jgi:dienelactone hydrolase
MKKAFALLLSLFSLALSAAAAPKIESKVIEYADGSVALEGYATWPTQAKGKVPGILLVHDWTGVQDYAKERAQMLAELGYAAFCVDIYGKGIRPPGPPASAEQAGIYKKDRALFRQRLTLGLAELKKLPQVDSTNLAAIGYCFGGTGVLELARSGADVKGVVSFHGGLDSPTPADGKNIKAKVLVLHGADDPYVPAPDIAAFTLEMNSAKVDWQIIYYSGAVHTFTKKAAGNDNSKGSAYNALADARSWVAMQNFFTEIFPSLDHAH